MRLFVTLLVLALIGAGVYIFLLKNGYTEQSMINRPLYYDLSVECSEITNLLVASEVDVTVRSNARTHNNVTVLITAYDKTGNITKQKRTTFDRTLDANGYLSKPVTLPANAKHCDCVIESSNPL